MKNTMNIVIQKNKQQLRFYIKGKEYPFQAVIQQCKRANIALCHVQTIENNQTLVDCYIPFQNENQFRTRLIRAAKAKA